MLAMLLPFRGDIAYDAALGIVVAWVVDDTGFVKKGTHSVGVARQYSGQVGKQENCRVAVSLSISTPPRQSSHRVAFVFAGELGQRPGKTKASRHSGGDWVSNRTGDRARTGSPGGRARSTPCPGVSGLRLW